MNLFKKYKINPLIILIFVVLIVLVANFGYSQISLKKTEHQRLSTRIDRNNARYEEINEASERLEKIQERYKKELAKNQGKEENNFLLEKSLTEKDISFYLNKYSLKNDIEIYNFNKLNENNRSIASSSLQLKTKSQFIDLINFLFDLEILNETVTIEKINIDKSNDDLINANFVIRY